MTRGRSKAWRSACFSQCCRTGSKTPLLPLGCRRPQPCLRRCAQAVILYYLSWRDRRVLGQVRNATELVLSGAGSCGFPCQSSAKVAEGGCCDDIWMPHIDHTNIYGLSQVGAPAPVHVLGACRRAPGPPACQIGSTFPILHAKPGHNYVPLVSVVHAGGPQASASMPHAK
jgi:hypothetical protein